MKFDLLRLTSEKPIPKKKLLQYLQKVIFAEEGAGISKLGPGVFVIWEPELKLSEAGDENRRIFVGKRRRPRGNVSVLAPTYLILRRHNTYIAAASSFSSLNDLWHSDGKKDVCGSKTWDKIAMCWVDGPKLNWKHNTLFGFFVRQLPKNLLVSSLRTIVFGARDKHVSTPHFQRAEIITPKISGYMTLGNAKRFVPRGMMLCGITLSAEYREKVSREQYLKLREVSLTKSSLRYGFPGCEIDICSEMPQSKSSRLRTALLIERLTDAIYDKSPRQLLKFLRAKPEVEREDA